MLVSQVNLKAKDVFPFESTSGKSFPRRIRSSASELLYFWISTINKPMFSAVGSGNPVPWILGSDPSE